MIRVFFADGTHEDRADDSPATRAEDGPVYGDKPARLLSECRGRAWAERNGQWCPVEVEGWREQNVRRSLEAENARLRGLLDVVEDALDPDRGDALPALAERMLDLQDSYAAAEKLAGALDAHVERFRDAVAVAKGAA